MTFTVLVAPSGFKESLSADQAADCIETGVLRALPGATVLKAPMVDGGEGFTKALIKATCGTLHHLTVTGPVNNPVEAHFGFLGGDSEPTAVIEMAAAAGLSLVPRDQRNPCLTTSYGVGELVRAALDRGAHRILLGCGDSGINDGGAGMAEALGIRLLDVSGEALPRGGAALTRLAAIDVSGRDPRLGRVRVDAAVNWHNVLLGERGVARIFGPQKGATPEQVELLAAAMETYAGAIQSSTGFDVGLAPGSGASGGLGARSSVSSAAGCTHATTSSCNIWSSTVSSGRPTWSSPRKAVLTGRPLLERCRPKWPHGQKAPVCLSSRSPGPSERAYGSISSTVSMPSPRY
jgi:glycerate kinase